MTNQPKTQPGLVKEEVEIEIIDILDNYDKNRLDIREVERAIGKMFAICEEAYRLGRADQKAEFKEMVHKLQKQCSEAEGTIDGITALHELLEQLKDKENNE